MIRQIRWQLLLVVLGVSLLAALLIRVAFQFTTVWVPSSGGTYVEGLAGTPRFINPLLRPTSQVDRDLCALIFNGLTRMGPRGQVVPDLAESWKVSPDGLTYTFTLRPRVRWHDGQYLSADDVLFTISLIQDPDYPGPADLAALWRSVTVTKVDARTIQFSLEQPYAPFLDHTTLGILPEHVLQEVPVASLPQHAFNLQPIGTGILRVKEDSLVIQNEQIESISLYPNPYYFRDEPQLDQIQFKFYPSYQSVYNAYLVGEVQGIGKVALEDIPAAQANPTLNLFTSPLPQHSLIFLNLNDPNAPFLAETEVRQALLYALDRQALIDKVLNGQAVVAHNLVFPNTWAYNPDIPHYEYDPAQAAALLDEAGWQIPGTAASHNLSITLPITGTFGVRRKGGQNLSFSLLVPDSPAKVNLAQEIARQWGLTGIGVTVEPISTGLVSDHLEPRQFEAALVDLASFGDPDPYPFWHETQIKAPGQNYAGYQDRDVSELLERARQTIDDEKRAEYYRQFQQIFAEQALAILLYHPTYTYAVDRDVYDVQMGPLVQPGDRFLGISRWYMRFKRVIQNVSQAEGTEAIGPLGTVEP